jgi:hypothetical protein
MSSTATTEWIKKVNSNSDFQTKESIVGFMESNPDFVLARINSIFFYLVKFDYEKKDICWDYAMKRTNAQLPIGLIVKGLAAGNLIHGRLLHLVKNCGDNCLFWRLKETA